MNVLYKRDEKEARGNVKEEKCVCVLCVTTDRKRDIYISVVFSKKKKK